MLCSRSAQVPDCTISVVSFVTAIVGDSLKEAVVVWVGFRTPLSLSWKETPGDMSFSYKKNPLWTLIWQAANTDLYLFLLSICLWIACFLEVLEN